MPANSLAVLQSSTDPKDLLNAALALARSDQPADHDALLKHLQSEEFLYRLDSKADYAQPGKRLRLARVIDALAINKAASAAQSLVALGQTTAFVVRDARADLLIEAYAQIRPPPAPVLRFWKEHSDPYDGFVPLTIEALIVNGSGPAMALLEGIMADPAHNDEEKIGWMHTSFLRHRDDAPLLLSCERMLQGALPGRLRAPLIEVLFDYKPDQWFRPAYVVEPPDRRLAGADARATLVRLGQWALQRANLSPEEQQAVKHTLEELKPRK